MYRIPRILFAIVLATVAFAQTPDSPLSDNRLAVSTLVREDIFAGFMADDMDRFARGEKNLDLLLQMRPGSKAEILAWKASASYYRAVRAYENKNTEEFKKHYKAAEDLFEQSNQAAPGNLALSAIRGGSNAIFADRLPEEYRKAGWSQAYDSFTALWKAQGAFVDKLPVHIRGELLAGLAQSSQRTGRKEETAMYVDKILAVLKDTPYEPVAKQWKANPEAAAKSSMSCRSCHDAGRLSVRLNALNSK